MARLVIFANGLIPDLESARQLLQPGDLLYAADGGTHHALTLGLLPSVVIGDLDSLTQEDRQILEAKGAEIQRFPRDKDSTDLELALMFVLQSGHREILIIGALGGRLDQTIANLSLLTDSRLSTCDIRLDDGIEEAFFIRTRSRIHGKPGDIVSLLPWGGEVTGITSQGLRWPLKNEILFPERTRGVSNVLSFGMAEIEIVSGLLLCIHSRK